MLNRYKHIAKELKEKLTNYIYDGKLTGGMEVKNKMGENTRCHCHFRFLSETKKDTMVKPLKGVLKKYDMDTTGNKHWYFKAIPEIDMAKFWRYPLKECLMPSLCEGYPLADLTIMAKIANAHLQTAIQINQKKSDNRDDSDTLFSKLCIQLKKDKIVEIHPAVTRTIQYYADDNRALNKATIVGYSYTYLVKEKHLAASTLASQWIT